MGVNKRLIMVGASGHGKVCAEIAALSGKYSEVFFLDDDTSVSKCGDYDVIGTSNNIQEYIDGRTEFFVSIGNYEHRSRIQEQIEVAGGTMATLIHPQAIISEEATVGSGSVVMPGSVINTGTEIGKGVIVNTSSSIDHDCTLGNWIHVAVGAHLCGTVSVGENTWIGAGATISNNISVGKDIIIGAGAVVVGNIDDPGIYVGVPARERQ